ncbi:MAG: RrF2 family transcriptional regulator [Fusobacteriota bacterium]
MKITKKTRYGLRALIYIAENSEEENLSSIKEISKAENISIQYLEQILYRLKKKDIIKGKSGPNGGYKLIKDPAKVKISEIVDILENGIKLVECDLDPKQCKKGDCSTIYLWNKLNNAIIDILEGTTLEELVNEHKNNK